MRCGDTAWALDFPGPAPKEAQARVDDAGFVLENRALTCKRTLANGWLKPACIVDKLSGTSVALGGAECFRSRALAGLASFPSWATAIETSTIRSETDVRGRTMNLEDYFESVSPDEIRLRGPRIGIEAVPGMRRKNCRRLHSWL